MTVRVAILGANGFLGGELVRLLCVHPKVTITARVAGRSAGSDLSDVRPSLAGPAAGPLVAFDPDALAQTADVALLALPHGESARAAEALLARGVRVLDLGSDFRLPDPDTHRAFYGRDAEALAVRDQAVYCLPELTGGPPANARLVANPGCFATALALMLAPLAPILDPTHPLAVFGVTGSTGSGVAPSAGVHHSLRVNSFVAYKTLRHQHWGEVRQLLASRGAVPDVRFVPHSLPAPRGIHLTAVVPRDALSRDVFAAYEAAYADAPFVDVTAEEVPMGAVLLSNRARLGVVEVGDSVVLFAAIDNLLKGGSGQAVQNLNLWHGWPETLGLPVVGAWP